MRAILQVDEYLRSTLHLHGPNLIIGPAHGLEGGVVIVHLPLLANEVLLFEHHHLRLLVALEGQVRKDQNYTHYIHYIRMNSGQHHIIQSDVVNGTLNNIILIDNMKQRNVFAFPPNLLSGGGNFRLHE